MNDFNQTPSLPGFEEYPDLPQSKMPDFGQFLQKGLEKDNAVNPGTFDPHALMVKKKEVEKGEVEDTTPKQTWPENDVKSLENFCKKMGIVGFNSGKMPPIVALAMLKQQYGIVEGPYEERVPSGYEKIGVKPTKFNPHYPYNEMMKSKGILHG